MIHFGFTNRIFAKDYKTNRRIYFQKLSLTVKQKKIYKNINFKYFNYF